MQRNNGGASLEVKAGLDGTIVMFITAYRRVRIVRLYSDTRLSCSHRRIDARTHVRMHACLAARQSRGSIFCMPRGPAFSDGPSEMDGSELALFHLRRQRATGASASIRRYRV